MIITHSRWIGSFQTSIRYESENPVEEGWSRVARLGATMTLRDTLCTSVEAGRADQIARYAALRIRQAVEFRQATRDSTVLTASLTLYYSFLNLVRALLSLSTAEKPSHAHGLRFSAAPNLFDTVATVQAGTFRDYLDRNGVSVHTGLQITLKDALARIIELLHDRSLPKHVASLGVSISIDAPRGGPLLLRFSESLDTFRANWTHEFPSLADNCILEPTGNVLRVDKEDISTSPCSFWAA
jgi:hypothetical protein